MLRASTVGPADKKHSRGTRARGRSRRRSRRRRRRKNGKTEGEYGYTGRSAHATLHIINGAARP